jgi:FMN-dependent NADH-azoreductase
MRTLILDANPRTAEHSHSKWALDVYLNSRNQDDIDVWSLYKMDIPHIDEDVFSAWGKLQSGTALSEEESAKIQKRNEILEAFMSFDHFVIVSPLWNFGVPPQLKALIDAVAVAGKTFKYTAEGPVGLLEGSFTHIQASGGIYSEMPEIEFGNRYIAHVMKFMGLTEKESLLLEGTNTGHFNRSTFLPKVEEWIENTRV